MIINVKSTSLRDAGISTNFHNSFQSFPIYVMDENKSKGLIKSQNIMPRTCLLILKRDENSDPSKVM